MNKIFFAEHPILAGDVVVLFLIESNIIEVVENQGNMINFFEEETFNTGSWSLTFYNVAFKARVFAVISTKFKYEINGLIDNEIQHPINWIAFSGLTAHGQVIKSNSKDLIFSDISSTVHYVNVNLTAIANQAYLFHFTLRYRLHNVFIRIETANNTPVFFPNNTQLSTLSFAAIDLEGYSAQNDFGVNLTFKESGSYKLNVSTLFEEIYLSLIHI